MVEDLLPPPAQDRHPLGVGDVIDRLVACETHIRELAAGGGVAELETRLGELEVKVTGLEVKVTDLQVRVTALESAQPPANARAKR